MILQPYCSRPHSIKAHLSSESWAMGGDVFLTQKIPFSSRNGPLFAAQLAELIASIVSVIQAPPYHVYEFGAGLGLLAKQVLDVLKAQYPVIYPNIMMHLTDGSPEMIAQLSGSSYFDAHREHIRFETLDLLQLDIPPHEPMILGYSVYLLDALETRQLQCHQGGVSEVLVQTTLRKGCEITNTLVYPPQPMTHSEIAHMCKNLGHPHSRILAPQLAQIIEESYQPVPLSECSHWAPEQIEQVTQFVNSLPHTAQGYFNYIPNIETHLATVQQHLHPDGVYLVSDFGLADTVEIPSVPELSASYGSTTFYSVCFRYLTYLAQSTQWTTWNTSRQLDQTQEWVLFKNPIYLDVVQRLFFSTTDPGIESVTEALDGLESIDPDEPEYIARVHRCIQSISPEAQADYFFLQKVSLQLFHDGAHGLALEWADRMIDHYGEFAISGYLVCGWIFQRQGELDLAIQSFNQAITYCPTMTMGYLSLGALYFSQQQFSEAQTLFKTALRYSSPNEVAMILKSIKNCESSK